ncbi:SAV_915 family protein [Actinoplanes sp. NPDC049265]|uniref:SAV_915 family protein n=1 Tax=Actinoplanes sp. NPDC049265 TaxID=3363902 RepID=UPI0037146EC7
MTTLPDDFPPAVYLPCVEHVRDPALARVALRATRDGRVALLAYSALDRLHDCCGRDQPWVLLPTRALPDLHESSPFDLLFVDLRVPAGAGD